MIELFTRLLRDESGATAIEYGLIATFIALVLVSVLQALGPKLGNTLNRVGDAMP